MNRFHITAALAALCLFFFTACATSASSNPGGPDGTPGAGGDGGGHCQPGTNFCMGNQVVTCTASGTPGSVSQMCPDGCQYGACLLPDGGGPTGDGGNSNCAAGATDLVYVVDNKNSLYSFDPTMMSFTKIGSLNCPAGSSLDGSGSATPFSMSVDRTATAWVLYSSGEVFKVSTKDASCTKTSFQPSQMGYDVFGMGFVSDSAGSNSEKLYVAGSTFGLGGSLNNTKLGYIDVSTLKVTNIKALNNLDNPPELTGTGDAKLYGYFPGSSSYVAAINKTTGAISSTHWPAGSVSGQAAGWAFAQWGGKFYVFITTQSGGLFGTSTSSKVVVVDPTANGGKGSEMDGKTSGVPFIVGAGVSTCAPVVVVN